MNFIQWTRGDTWLYGANVSGKWASNEKHEILLTFSFGPNDNPESGQQKQIDVSIHNPSEEEIPLIQGNVKLILTKISWINPAAGQHDPTIAIDAIIVEGDIAQVQIRANLDIVVLDAS